MTEASSENSLRELFIRVSSPWLESLSTPGTLNGIEQICREFSLDNSPFLVFECPLDDDASVLDLSFEVFADGFGQLLHKQHHATNSAGGWERVRSYCDEYKREDSLLGRHVAHTWLEYDTGSEAEMDLPSMFIELDNSGDQRYRFSDDPDGTFEALRQSAIILNPTLSDTTIAMMKQCGLLLPEPAGVLGIGIMLARPGQALRFCANHVPLDELEDYLKALAWPGSAQTLLKTLPQLPGYEPSCRIAFDISETIGDRIGIEIVAQPVNRFRKHEDWRLWLDALVEGNLCTELKRDILTDWLGQTTHAIDNRYTPDRIFRDISHLKFTFDTSGKLRTKAYLHAAHVSGGSVQGWFYHQFENLEKGAPPPVYSGM